MVSPFVLISLQSWLHGMIVKLPEISIVRSIATAKLKVPLNITFHYSIDGRGTKQLKFSSVEPFIPDKPLHLQFYRVSLDFCGSIYTKNVKLNTTAATKVDGVDVLGDDNYNTLGIQFMNVLYNKNCMLLPVPGDSPPGLMVALNYDLLGVQPESFLMNVSGIGLFCDDIQERQIKVYTTSHLNNSMCSDDVRFCRRLDVINVINSWVTCLFHCNCVDAVHCSVLQFMFVSSMHTDWSLCEISATNT
ncbi:uncharacterized protein [Argopecten irradians]|uniref:uncharacterized protein n=1 Tax=Argopecten irradians TaxID=31199 RepID=UPI00371E7D36